MNKPGLFNALYARYLYSMNMSFTKKIFHEYVLLNSFINWSIPLALLLNHFM